MCSSLSTQSRMVGSVWLTVAAAALSLLMLGGCPRASIQDVARELFDMPQVESVAPTSGPATGGTKVTISGHNFNPNAGVLFGDMSADSVSCMNRGLIEAVTPPQSPGVVDITVVNAVGQKSVVENAFEYVAVEPPAPRPVTLGGIAPTQGPANASTPITIFGVNFAEGMIVMLGAFVCDEVQLINPHTLQAVAPPQGPGFVDLVVRGPDGETVTMADAFEYVAALSGDLPGPPRLVSAVSTGNTTVRVTFSEPVEEGADDPSNYSIVQTNVNPEAGVLHVVSATLEPGQTVVTLVTFSQNEVVYTLTVTNIKDLAGHEFATPGIMVNPTETSFAGTPPVDDETVDTDGDGLPDHVEQRGWTVHVRLTNGGVEERGVTSDPTSPDTDQDGVGDQEEHRRGMDPRNPDTDADQVSDRDEVGTWFSNPTDQDTDQDGLADIADISFKTSPILADTDGDGFDDRRELFEMNRDPRLADLPQPELTVGDMRLQIDERYSYVDHEGNTVTEASSSSSTLSQSDSTKFSHSDTDTNESFIEAGVSMKFDPWPSEVTVSAKGGHKWGSTSQTSQESARSSQQAYQESLAKGRTYTTTQTVSREVYGASLDVGLTLGNTSDIAFTLGNVEVSVMQPGRTRTQFVPVATLLPSTELLTGEPAVFNLFPLEQRGPILFSNREIFPNLVEDLMRAPRGMIFKVTYFDITDEFGRNLAYITQDVLERTGTLTVDPGNGTFERFYVATSGGMDTHGYAGGGLVGGYDADGVAKGIPMDFVLQDILGLVKNPRQPNAIVAGPNEWADTIAEGDDIQAIPAGTDGLTDRDIVILAGENGILDTEPNNVTGEFGDDRVAYTTGYQTSRTCNADTDASIVEPESGGDGKASTVAKGDDVQEVPVRLCVAGVNDGQLCVEDAECPEAYCELSYICVGGDKDGVECDEDRDCHGYCDLDADSGVCVGGENDGNECDEDRDCHPYCDLDAVEPVCVGGDHAGEVCTEDAYCIAASCDLVGTCAGGFNEGNACIEDRECVTHCDGSVCVGGENDGNECDEDEECLPYCGDDDLCAGGEKDGDACTQDRDCLPHCMDFVCFGGDQDGKPCTGDDDCPGGTCTDDDVLPGQIIITAGPNGLLESVANGDDVYSGPGEICATNADCPGEQGRCTGREVLVRYENSVTGDPNRFWVILSSDEIPVGTDFGDALLRPDEALTLAFGQDIDRDGLFAREEYLYGSSDRLRDTDEEGLGDYAEIRVGWHVTVYRPLTAPSHRKVFPHPTLADSDFDGLDDRQELQCATDPRKRDTDGDGLSDLTELGVCTPDGDPGNRLDPGDGVEPCGGNDAVGPGDNGDFDTEPAGDDIWYPDSDSASMILPGDNGVLDTTPEGDDIHVSTECPDAGRRVCASIAGVVCDEDYHSVYPPEYLDARNADTDGDSLEDGFELSVSGEDGEPANPLDPSDADKFRDTDLDGLTDWEERAGWQVNVHQCDQPNCTPAVTTTWCALHPECARAENKVQNGEFVVDSHHWEVSDPYHVHWQSDPGWDGDPGCLSLNTATGQEAEAWQEISSLEVGTTYVVSGLYKTYMSWLRGSTFEVLLDDSVEYVGGHQRVDDWTPFGFSFTATGASVTLRFKGQVGGYDSDYLIDGIHLETFCRCYPNPLEGDSDFDGLPDYLERELGTNPGDDDTDCDGILDYDEFAEFGTYMNLTNVYPGFYLSGAGSQQLGTDPTSQDTDEDRLPDNFELTDGWRVLVPDEDVLRERKSDPLFTDTDLDGLSDLEEYLGKNGLPPSEDAADYDATDPTDPDTDDDGRLDGRERDVDTDPLRKDLKVTVSYEYIVFNEVAWDDHWHDESPKCGDDPGTQLDQSEYGEYYFDFYVKTPASTFPGQRPFTQCEWLEDLGDHGVFCRTKVFRPNTSERFPEQSTVESTLTPGQAIQLYVKAIEVEGCSYDDSEDDVDCLDPQWARICGYTQPGESYRMQALRVVSFEELLGVPTFLVELSLIHRDEPIGDTDMTVHAVIEID